MSEHIRNTGPMLASPRCGARTRSGSACRSPAVHGKKRCRMHGGALGSGAPRANQNARKHGLFSRDAIAERRQVRTLLGEARKLLEEMKCLAFASGAQTERRSATDQSNPIAGTTHDYSTIRSRSGED